MEIRYYNVDEDILADEPKFLCSRKCEDYAEAIKFFDYCKKNDILFFPNEYDSEIADEMRDVLLVGSYVNSFNVIFGSNEIVEAIEVYLK